MHELDASSNQTPLNVNTENPMKRSYTMSQSNRDQDKDIEVINPAEDEGDPEIKSTLAPLTIFETGGKLLTLPQGLDLHPLDPQSHDEEFPVN